MKEIGQRTRANDQDEEGKVGSWHSGVPSKPIRGIPWLPYTGQHLSTNRFVPTLHTLPALGVMKKWKAHTGGKELTFHMAAVAATQIQTPGSRYALWRWSEGCVLLLGCLTLSAAHTQIWLTGKEKKRKNKYTLCSTARGRSWVAQSQEKPLSTI